MNYEEFYQKVLDDRLAFPELILEDKPALIKKIPINPDLLNNIYLNDEKLAKHLETVLDIPEYMVQNGIHYYQGMDNYLKEIYGDRRDKVTVQKEILKIMESRKTLKYNSEELPGDLVKICTLTGKLLGVLDVGAYKGKVIPKYYESLKDPTKTLPFLIEVSVKLLFNTPPWKEALRKYKLKYTEKLLLRKDIRMLNITHPEDV